MSFYNKDSIFAEKPIKVTFELILNIVLVFLVIHLIGYIPPSISRGGRPDPKVQRCAKNEGLLSTIISEYNSTVESKDQITEINDETIKVLTKEGFLPKDFAPPLKECKYILTDEKTDFGNKVVCEYHGKQRQEIQKATEEKRKSEEKIKRIIQIFFLIWGLLHALVYFLLALFYKEKERNIYFFIGSIVAFLILIILSYVLSPVQKIHVTTYKGEHFIEYKHMHPLSDLLPFLSRKEYINDSEFLQKMFLEK